MSVPQRKTHSAITSARTRRPAPSTHRCPGKTCISSSCTRRPAYVAQCRQQTMHNVQQDHMREPTHVHLPVIVLVVHLARHALRVVPVSRPRARVARRVSRNASVDAASLALAVCAKLVLAPLGYVPPCAAVSARPAFALLVERGHTLLDRIRRGRVAGSEARHARRAKVPACARSFVSATTRKVHVHA